MNPAPEDVAAMRADGDLLDFVRSLAPSVTAKTPPAEEAPPPDIEISILRPGAWPVGTRPPEPPAPAPPGAWDNAIHRYRAGEDTGQPCGCTRCQIAGT